MGNLVTVAEAKAFLRINSAMVDSQIDALVSGVESWAANFCGTSWTVRSVTDWLDGGCGFLAPSVRPLVSVSDVYDFERGASVDESYWRVMEDAVYYVGNGSVANWPAGRKRFRLAYSAGYNDGDAIKAEGSVAAPSGLKLAVLAVVDRLFRVRGGNTIQGVQGNMSRWDALIHGDCGDLLGPFTLRDLAH